MTKTFVPHDYQREIIDWICTHRRCAVWAPMGGGKSVSTLAALEALSVIEDVYPVLILAPLRVAKTTWPLEASKWQFSAHLRVSVIAGSAKERERAAKAEADIYCANYDNLTWLVDFYGTSWPFRTVVSDESTKLKSFRIRQGGARAGALGKVAFKYVDRFIELTGTPAPNGLKDLWGQIFFLDQGERLGRTFSAFEQRWFAKGYDGYSIVPFAHSQAEIQERLRDICVTIAGLPVDDPIENLIYVDLPPKARRVYADMERDMFAAIEREGVDKAARDLASDVEVEAANAAVKVNKCRQIANGFLFHEGGKDWEVLHNAKFDALDSVVEEAAGAPLLVSYTFVPDRERLRGHYRQARVLGSDPNQIASWNRCEIPILLLHPASAGHGLSLQDGGNILADFGVDWNLEHDAQVIERIGPARQKQSGYDRPVFRHRIIARNTIEEAVLERVRTKRSVQDVLLDAMRRTKA